MVKAKKSLGQHFLRSEKALLDIVHASCIEKGDVVLEIGPGEGVLTERLIKEGALVTAVEKDDHLYLKLKDRFAKEIKEKKLKLVHGDIIEVAHSLHLKKGKYKLVANIPYYLTGIIVRTFISYSLLPQRTVLLVQKEVAERAIAKGGKQSVLSVMLGLFGSSIIISTVKRGSFTPAPTVDSSILCMWPHKKSFIKNTEHEYKCATFVKTAFAHKRKLMERNLDDLVEKEILLEALEEIGVGKNARAEDLKIDQWMSVLEKLI